MFFINKKITNYLYIIFIILNFNFIEFSTNKAVAKTFVVSKIEVEQKYNINFNKLKVIDRGFKKAFQDLSKMILERKDINKIIDTSIEDIKKLVENFTILDEKFINEKYKSIMEVEFNRDKLIKFLNSKNITLSFPKKTNIFFLPILVNLETNNFYYLNENIFAINWLNIQENYFLINYILPNEDMEDYLTIKNNLKNIEDYNFKKILKKYDFENYSFENKNIYNQADLNSMILSIKNDYEDNWKNINKMSPSLSVPIRLSLESININKSLKLERALTNLDFVNNYIIERFDSNEVIYKIYYSGSPKRFLKEILLYNIDVDTSSTNWKIK